MIKPEEHMSKYSKLPALSSNPQPAPSKIEEPPITEPLDRPQSSKGESLEERKLRLEARRDALRKLEEEKQPDSLKPPEQKREQGDVFRRTGMKWNESETQKRERLNRCLNVLKEVHAEGGLSQNSLISKQESHTILESARNDGNDSDGITDADLTILS